ncbi:conserved membrane protein [Hyperthermus butylicus DSM 5456]|uniref:Conserved membrane protein n=1 Tax=Hyperthermus butylicus (strain DSM 5456 / JCM 9403 / PLM1-5) TaxID=415426 RepID=A2BJI9_HYPBU|nr:conserved membrane protein [Hyperthermus butylicus DSM 5456]
MSTMYASLGFISMGSTATSLASAIPYASAVIRYVTRFTRLNSKLFVVEDLASSITALVATASTIIVSTVLLAWQRYGILVVPENPFGLLAVLVVLGIFYYLLAVMLGFAALAAGYSRFKHALVMLPPLLSFIPYAALFVDVGNSIGYIYPASGLVALAIGYASGETPPASGILEWTATWPHTGFKPVDPLLVAVSTATWLALMTAASVVLVRRSKSVSVEEVGPL